MKNFIEFVSPVVKILIVIILEIALMFGVYLHTVKTLQPAVDDEIGYIFIEDFLGNVNMYQLEFVGERND